MPDLHIGKKHVSAYALAGVGIAIVVASVAAWWSLAGEQGHSDDAEMLTTAPAPVPAQVAKQGDEVVAIGERMRLRLEGGVDVWLAAGTFLRVASLKPLEVKLTVSHGAALIVAPSGVSAVVETPLYTAFGQQARMMVSVRGDEGYVDALEGDVHVRRPGWFEDAALLNKGASLAFPPGEPRLLPPWRHSAILWLAEW
jgi:ferric-dicitrate binding protein FerR (iron transport regulator)